MKDAKMKANVVYIVCLAGIVNDVFVKKYESFDSIELLKEKAKKEISINGCVPLEVYSIEELEQKRKKWLNS